MATQMAQDGGRGAFAAEHRTLDRCRVAMVAAHEHAIAEHDPSFRIEWRSLGRLTVGDDVSAEVLPFSGCRTEPASQLLATPLR